VLSKKIDNFFISHFSGFQSSLSHKGISNEQDYFDYLISDPAHEVEESNRIKSAIGTLKKVKEFTDNYGDISSRPYAPDFFSVKECLVSMAFEKDAGVSVKVGLNGDSEGELTVSRASYQAITKVPFKIIWGLNRNNEEIGNIHLLHGNRNYPELFSTLSKFEFVRDSQLGMNSDIGYSLRDLEDPLFLMKSRIIDFSDTLPLINAVSHKSIEGLGFAPHLVS
tara:strand:+ start:480 stop:1148 length:669 start_codon:yes stop_codon:yes gene_type:complete